MTLPFPFPRFYAHRGASAHAPENTLAAFELAARQNAPAIELDVKLTADRRVIVLHDQTLNRTTNGSGPIRGLPLAAFRELDAGSWFSNEFRGEKIPTLDEVFETVGKKLHINVELTNYASPWDGLADEVAALVKKFNLQDRVLFSSFFPTNLQITRKYLPGTPRGQLVLPGASGWWQRLAGNFMDLQAEHPYHADVTEESVHRSHSRGRRVQVWTVNDPQEMQRLATLGVDAIFTDNPLLALQQFHPTGVLE